MQQLKRMLGQQHNDLEELTSELQRKEVTPDRVIRLIKIVRRNLELLERMAAVLDAMGAPDIPDTDLPQRLLDLTKAQEQLKRSR
jgi:hypothetical protein